MRTSWAKSKALSTIYHSTVIWSYHLFIFTVPCFKPSSHSYKRFFLYVNLIQCFLKLIISMPLFNFQYNVKTMTSPFIFACLCASLLTEDLIVWQSEVYSWVSFSGSPSYLITIVYQAYDQSAPSPCDTCLH